MKLEIMLDDLIPDVRSEVMKALGISTPAEGNYDLLPIFTLDTDDMCAEAATIDGGTYENGTN